MKKTSTTIETETAPQGSAKPRCPKPLSDFASINPGTDLSSLNLDWTEQDLPERERTKHVHRLHPYLGKFIPQLAEVFLRKFSPRVVCDPFCGSGTTLVEANVLGIDAIGYDISPFNCLLSRVKTSRYDIDRAGTEIFDILQRVSLQARPSLFQEAPPAFHATVSDYLRKWYAPESLRELLLYLSLIPDYEHRDLLSVILSRAARSARLAAHFDLDFPKKPVTEPYYCHKHKRTCLPTENALQFLERYSVDTLQRLREFAFIHTEARIEVFCADSRTASIPEIDACITSPPYVGLIDYHEQHRYAYELLGLEGREDLEIGAASKGRTLSAKRQYIEQIGEVFANVRRSLRPNGVVVIIVNDSMNLYQGIEKNLGYTLEERLERQVNRRTGRRPHEFSESILVWRKR